MEVWTVTRRTRGGFLGTEPPGCGRRILSFVQFFYNRVQILKSSSVETETETLVIFPLPEFA